MPARPNYDKPETCLRYVTARPSAGNPKRWYWQRPGFPMERLSRDPVDRLSQARELNRRADGDDALAPGSIGWVIATYKETDEYKALKKGTLKYYDRVLADIKKLKASLPFSAFTRRAVIAFVGTYSKGMQQQAAAILNNLFNVAIYHEYAKENYARALRLGASKRREQTFTEDEAKRWLSHCVDDPAMRLAFAILRHAVQRPGDSLAMTWARYNGDTIRLRQEKTGKLLDVPCHEDLRAELDAAKKTARHDRIVADGLKALSYSRFCVRFRRIANAAGLPKHQARDLRRTAAVRMAEAGATTIEIAAIAGWSIEYTTQILETYVPRNVEMAREGVRKWEEKGKKKADKV